MDNEKLERACSLILEAIGEDPNREGLVETPKRFSKMLAEQLRYTGVRNEDIAEEFNKAFPSEGKEMVVLDGINVFSYCEHHIALMYNMTVAVGYIPDGKVIGLSKVARIADAVCRRLQLQERITSDIQEIIKTVVGTEDVIVAVQGEHSCMTARGIKKPGTKTRTMAYGGVFDQEPKRAEFLALLK